MARSSAQAAPLVALAAATVATLAVVVVPTLRFAYQGPAARVALETTAALIALLAGYLVLGRFLRARGIRSLFLSIALAALAVTNLVVAVLLATSPRHDTRLLATTGSLAGALLFAIAAYLPPRRLLRRRALTRALGVAAGVILASILLMAGLDLLYPVEPPALVSTSRPFLEDNVPLLVGQLLAMGAFAAAAVGYFRRARQTEDSFVPFVAVAMVLGAFARLQYVLFGPVHAGLVHTGDVFRFLFYLVLLVGAAREIELYWRGLARAAVLEERQRIARELHDGVAQELALIGARASRLLGGSADAPAREIVAAAQRGLLDSRRAIAALTRPLDQPLSQVLVEAVQDFASRYEVELELEVAPDVDVAPATREALVRIAGEAISNAARHGGAKVVRITLENGDPVRFSVSDDGSGFDVTAPAPGRFGFTMMRERASAVGGSLRVRSSPGHGTAVEVELP